MKIRLLIAAMLVTGAAHSQKPPPTALDKQMAYDGLEAVTVRGISLAYKRPGASLAGYKRVMIDPVEVRFAKNWGQQNTGSRLPVSASYREDVRAGLSKVVRDEFVKALAMKGGYPIADAAAPDVLRLKIYIVNLYINAPPNQGAGVSYSFVASAGEMTLFMELYDSETGQILARVADREEARTGATLQMASSVSNVGEAASIAAGWARIMRDALDRAHAAMK